MREIPEAYVNLETIVKQTVFKIVNTLSIEDEVQDKLQHCATVDEAAVGFADAVTDAFSKRLRDELTVKLFDEISKELTEGLNNSD